MRAEKKQKREAAVVIESAGAMPLVKKTKHESKSSKHDDDNATDAFEAYDYGNVDFKQMFAGESSMGSENRTLLVFNSMLYL